MKKRRYTAIVFGVLAVAWACVLFFFSGQSGTDSGMLSNRMACMIVKWFPFLGGPADFEPILRKMAHFSIFAAEGFFVGMSLICVTGGMRGAALSFGICALMAVANEYHQRFSEGRSCEVMDMLIDSGGAALGVIAAAAVIAVTDRILRKRTRKTTPGL